MKPLILVVDDDPAKVAALRRFFESEGIPAENVCVAMSAASARVLLDERFFDLMLLDVLLPAREGDAPAGDVSVDLLRQMVEDGTSSVPANVVAITADSMALRQHEAAFRRMTTQVLQVEVGDSSWRGSLGLLLAKLEREKASRNVYEFDLCIQTALRVPEQSALIESWDASWKPEEYLGKGVLVRRGILGIGGKEWRIACAHAVRPGALPAFHVAGLLMREFRPRILAMTGICGGIGEAVAVGDIVIAQKSWDWQSGKWNEEGELLSEIDQKDGSADLLAAAQGVECGRIYQAYPSLKPASAPRLHVAPMVSGSSVITYPALHKILKDQHRKVAAIDMECFGLYYAVDVAEGVVPEVICIKAVSDLADGSKSDDYQRFCSHLSATMMLETIERWVSLRNG